MSDMTVASRDRIQPLLNRHKAPGDFYDEVHRQLNERIPRLKFDKEYKANDLVEPDFWGSDVALHRLIGRCIAHLVATRQVPLRFAGCPRCTNKRYLRT